MLLQRGSVPIPTSGKYRAIYIPKMLVCHAVNRWVTQWNGSDGRTEEKQGEKAKEGHSVATVVLRRHYGGCAA